MSGTFRVVLFASWAVVVGGAAQAQEDSARRGLAAARETCAICHGIRKGDRSPNPNAPAFDVIAAVPGMTGLALQSVLLTSHREMPNLIIPADERADLIAYILSLKAN